MTMFRLKDALEIIKRSTFLKETVLDSNYTNNYFWWWMEGGTWQERIRGDRQSASEKYESKAKYPHCVETMRVANHCDQNNSSPRTKSRLPAGTSQEGRGRISVMYLLAAPDSHGQRREESSHPAPSTFYFFSFFSSNEFKDMTVSPRGWRWPQTPLWNEYTLMWCTVRH